MNAVLLSGGASKRVRLVALAAFGVFAAASLVFVAGGARAATCPAPSGLIQSHQSVNGEADESTGVNATYTPFAYGPAATATGCATVAGYGYTVGASGTTGTGAASVSVQQCNAWYCQSLLAPTGVSGTVYTDPGGSFDQYGAFAGPTCVSVDYGRWCAPSGLFTQVAIANGDKPRVGVTGTGGYVDVGRDSANPTVIATVPVVGTMPVANVSYTCVTVGTGTCPP